MTVTITPGTCIPLRLIGVSAKLGDGGQGAVFATDAVYAGRRLVYKAYKPGPRTELDVVALESMTTAVVGLGQAARDEFLDTFAWPIAPVTDDGGIAGFLMPAVPGEFYALRGRGDNKTLRLNDFQHLLNAPEFVARLGIRVSRRSQLELLIATAEALSLLHFNNIAVGDLSPRNLLFDADHGRVYFVDCDAMMCDSRTVLPQVETPGWEVPAGESTANADGDAYKFALLALRLLAGDQDTRDPDRLPRTQDTLRPFVIRGLADVGRRPQPGEWIPSLTVAAKDASIEPLGVGTDRSNSSGRRGTTIPDTAAVKPPTSPGHSTSGHTAPAIPPPSTARPSTSPSAPTRSTPRPARQPPTRDTGSLVFALGAVVLIGIIVLVAWLTHRDTSQSPEMTSTPVTLMTPSAYTPPGDPPPVSPPPSAPSPTMPVHASSAPAGSTGEYCGTTSFPYRPDADTAYVRLTITVGDSVPATHCNFARAVAADVGASDDHTLPITVHTTSPNTGATYAMTCVSVTHEPIVLRCDDGNTAVVYLYY